MTNIIAAALPQMIRCLRRRGAPLSVRTMPLRRATLTRLPKQVTAFRKGEMTMAKPGRLKVVTAILVMLIQSTLFTPPLSADTNGGCHPQFLPSPYYTQSDIKGVFKEYCDSGSHLPTHLQIDFFTPQGTTTMCYRQAGGGGVATITTNSTPLVTGFRPALSFIFLDNNVPPELIRLLLAGAPITTN